MGHRKLDNGSPYLLVIRSIYYIFTYYISGAQSKCFILLIFFFHRIETQDDISYSNNIMIIQFYFILKLYQKMTLLKD